MMMEELYSDKFLKIFYDKQNNIVIVKWFAESVQIETEEQIKSRIYAITRILKENKPFALIADDRNRKFMVPNQIQRWIAQMIRNACKEAGVKKFAIVTPEDFLANVSTNLIVSEMDEIPYQLEFFSSFEEAKKWVIF